MPDFEFFARLAQGVDALSDRSPVEAAFDDFDISEVFRVAWISQTGRPLPIGHDDD
jgi:hypothetical protein